MTATVAAARAPRTAALSPPLVAAVAATAVASLAALYAWGASPAGKYLVHRVDAPVETTYGAAILLFTASWVLMTGATMVPTALPLLSAFRMLVSGRHDSTVLTWWVVAGFFSVWTVVGLAAGLLDVAAHGVLATTGLEEHPRALAAGGLALAAAYQLSPLAGRCLQACRSPFGFFGRHWTGAGDTGWQSFSIGAAYAWSCLGCCAALMVVMLGVGMGNVGWMLGLGAVAAVEKGVGFGQGLRITVGFLLAAAAVATAASWI